MKQPPIKTKELSGNTVQIADGQNWEIAFITAYGETPQGGTTEAPVALTGVDSVQVSGNNLFVNNAVTETKSGITFTVNTDRSITVNGTASTSASVAQYTGYNLTLPDGGYALSGTSSLTGVEVGARIKRANGDNEWFTVDSYLHTRTFNIATGDIIVSFYVLVRAGQTADNVTVYPMLNVGSTALPYEPYNGSITQLPIPRPLHKVGDVRDVCVTRVKSIYDKRIVLDGSENWTARSNTSHSFVVGLSVRSLKGLSDSYYSMRVNNIGVINGVYLLNTSSITITDLAYSTVEEFKAHLSEHPLTVYYQSADYDGTNGLDICLTEYQNGFVELDGTEVWAGYARISTVSGNFYEMPIPKKPEASNVQVTGTLSSHLTCDNAYTKKGDCVWAFVNAQSALSTLRIGFSDDSIDTAEKVNAYLAAQKEAGTPVQIAYQLATPEVYATDPVDFDNTAGPLTVMTGGEVAVALTHRMLTPYTAWAIRYDSEGEYTGDFFNVEDYDRIKQNIEYLREYAYFLYGGFTMRDMVAVTVESYGYSSTIDALDANLEAIAANTFRPPDMLPVKQWRGNQPPPGPDDWNRIENTCLLLFEQFERQFACLPKLAFELKGSAF